MVVRIATGIIASTKMAMDNMLAAGMEVKQPIAVDKR